MWMEEVRVWGVRWFGMEKWREGWRGVLREEKKRREREEERGGEEEEQAQEEKVTDGQVEQIVTIEEEKMPGAFCSSTSSQLDW